MPRYNNIDAFQFFFKFSRFFYESFPEEYFFSFFCNFFLFLREEPLNFQESLLLLQYEEVEREFFSVSAIHF